MYKLSFLALESPATRYEGEQNLVMKCLKRRYFIPSNSFIIEGSWVCFFLLNCLFMISLIALISFKCEKNKRLWLDKSELVSVECLISVKNWRQFDLIFDLFGLVLDFNTVFAGISQFWYWISQFFLITPKATGWC